MKECQNLQEFLQAFFPENAELEGFRKRLAADATPDREGLTEALREPDAGEQIRLFEGGDAAGLAAARSRAYSAAFYDACFPEAGSAEQALSRERLRFFYRGAANERYLLAPGVYRTGEKPEDFYFHELQVRCPAPFAGRLSGKADVHAALRCADAPARYHGKSARCPVFCLRSGA